MAEPRYLVDTSVLARADIEAVGSRLEKLVVAGKLWTCRAVDLELVYATRAREVAEVILDRLVLPEAPITPEVMNRALQVAGLMASKRAHRGAKPTDLIIAAAAERRGLTVLHYDQDFERIARITGQATEWVARPGSLSH